MLWVMSTRVSYILDDHLVDLVRQEAVRRGVSQSRLVREALVWYLTGDGHRPAVEELAVEMGRLADKMLTTLAMWQWTLRGPEVG